MSDSVQTAKDNRDGKRSESTTGGALATLCLAALSVNARRITPNDGDDVVALQRLFGANFKAARLALGLTQAEAAKLADIRIATISEVENGRVNLTIRQMQRLADIVNRDVSSLTAQPPTKP